MVYVGRGVTRRRDPYLAGHEGPPYVDAGGAGIG